MWSLRTQAKESCLVKNDSLFSISNLLEMKRHFHTFETLPVIQNDYLYKVQRSLTGLHAREFLGDECYYIP